ncbi:MAG TPA: Tex family protein [Candidatus Kapabacteria bacterium]|nr:Tex family protein [Candidatus Kapabacteria bacterium]
MLNIPQILSAELSLQPWQVANTLELFNEGGTIPFVARYRKERTGEMNEIQLRELQDRHAYLTELEARKLAVLESIESQGKLTDELRAKITATLQKNELEDLYLPYKPRRRTRATIAREKGLEPLADVIRALNTPDAVAIDLDAEAAGFVSEEKEVKSVAEAIQGALDILAEEIAEKAELRAWVRTHFMNEGMFTSRVKDDFPEGTTKFEMYRDYRVRVKDVASHNLLALRRGETEGVLSFDLTYDETAVLEYLRSKEIHTPIERVRELLAPMIKDAFDRLMKFSLVGEVRLETKVQADIESIRTFETNLRELLLASPAGMKPTLGVDPGFRTGCKVVAIDRTGKFLEYQTVFPHQSAAERERAAATIRRLVEQYEIELVAIGNGTAGRETDEFVAEAVAPLDRRPVKVMVNESGASIYSASEVAIEEFPDKDITVRGAVSIARRLQDPLAELVKIDAKSIGVGQYQHDVDQRLLKKKLDETVESCVNYVGVDLNLASKELLSYVSGITPTVAKSIVSYRNDNGAFRNRRELLKVPKLGPKAFEQAAGFLRIRGGNNPLDATAVHPESYHVVETMAAEVGVPLEQVTAHADRFRSIDLKKFVTEAVGEPTLRDIVGELEKPGRDPRAEFTYATFKEGIKELKDLREGMELEGVVTNVANFGAFVDIGVHQDGLVHVSQVADRFVNDPKEVVKVGQIVKVRVLEVNEKLKRIGLSMKSQNGGGARSQGARGGGGAQKREAPKQFTLDDLKAKFAK